MRPSPIGLVRRDNGTFAPAGAVINKPPHHVIGVIGADDFADRQPVYDLAEVNLGHTGEALFVEGEADERMHANAPIRDLDSLLQLSKGKPGDPRGDALFGRTEHLERRALPGHERAVNETCVILRPTPR